MSFVYVDRFPYFEEIGSTDRTMRYIAKADLYEIAEGVVRRRQ